MNEDRIIIEVEVNAGKSAEDLANVRSRMDALKDAQKTLKKEMKELQAVQLKNGQLNSADAKTLAELNKQYANNAADLKELTAQEKVYTAQIQIATQNDRKYGDSITELGAQLAQLKQEYRSLSAEQRESAEGKEMLENIQQLDEEVKNLDYSLGDHQRNVGNYTSALLGLNGNVAKVAAMFAGGFSNGIKAATTALKGFATTLLTTPVGWILAALAAISAGFKQVSEAIKRSDDMSTEFQETMAGWEMLKTRFRTGWDRVAGGVVSALSAISEGFSKLGERIEKTNALLFGDATLEQVRNWESSTDKLKDIWAGLIDEEDKLQEADRQYMRAHADRERDIAALNKSIVQTETYTAKERQQMAERINQLEEEDMRERAANAKKHYELIKQRYALEVDTSDEAKDAIAKAYAEMVQAETDYLNGTVRIAKRANQIAKEQEQEAERERQQRAAAAKEAQQRRAEALEKEREALRAFEDMRISMIEDERQRERAELLTSYTRQIEDLQRRLDTEKNMTVKTREAINAEIELLNRKMSDDILKFDQETAKNREEKAKAEAERVLKEAETLQAARIAAMDAGKDKDLAQLKANTDKAINELKRRAEAEGATAEEITYIHEQMQLKLAEYAEKQYEIEKKYREQAVREEFARTKARMDNELKAALQAAGDNAATAAALELEAAQKMYDQLVSMDADAKAAMFKTDEQYTAAVLAANERIMQAQKKSQQAIESQIKEIATTMQSVTGAISSVFEAVAGDTEEFERFKKAMAIVDATISLAQTIAAATAASTEGDPYTMAIRIATNVAAVTAQFAALIKAIKAASIPAAPAFAEGGIVPGNSWTGDKVTAKVNSGEMILTKEQQAKLFDLIQAGVPQEGIDYRLLARAVAEGVAALPAPVLDYSEFTRFERKVKQVEKIVRL